jgi:hypothetical protein
VVEEEHLLPQLDDAVRIQHRRRVEFERVAEPRQRLFVDAVHHGEEQILFAVEVLVDRAARVAGGFRDLVERGGAEPAAHEHVLGRVEEGGSRPLPAPFRRPFLHRHARHCCVHRVDTEIRRRILAT